MRKVLLVTVLLGGLVLGGCRKPVPKPETKQSTAATTTKVAKESSTKESSEPVKTIWSEEQNKKLADFMVTWGNEMGQTYQNHTHGDGIDWYGDKLKGESFNGDGKFKFDSEKANGVLLPSELAPGKFNIVAMYTDVAHAAGATPHLYLFTIRNAVPVVLITETGKNSEGLLEFRETANQDLKNGFAQIVTEGSQTSGTSQESAAPAPSGDSSQFDQLSPALQALLAANIVDERIKQYPGLEGMELYYKQAGDLIYVHLTSGAGTGHPVFLLQISGDSVTPLQGVVYLGADGYGAASIKDTTSHSKASLYEEYQKDKGNYDTAVGRTKESANLPADFEKFCGLAGISPSQGTGADAAPQGTSEKPDANKIMDIFAQIDGINRDLLSVKGQNPDGSIEIAMNTANGYASTHFEGDYVVYQLFSYSVNRYLWESKYNYKTGAIEGPYRL